MAGNESPRLVRILIRLAQNWAINKNSYERFEKRQCSAGDSAEADDDEGEARWTAYHDDPFPDFVRLVDQNIGFGRDAIHLAALKEFDGERELVEKLNALDDRGITAELFEVLRAQHPNLVRQLYTNRIDAVTPKPGPVKPVATDATSSASLIDRLLFGPDDVELTARELALLEAHLKQPVSLAQLQREAQAGATGTLTDRNKLNLIRDFNRNLLRTATSGTGANDDFISAPSAITTKSDAATPRRKKSTAKGEGQAKLIAALTKHHQYANGGCLNLEPIGNNELARMAEVDQATASAFFQKQFKGHGKYKTACAEPAGLSLALKLLNGEFSPHLLYGAKPPDEVERDED